MTHSVSAAEKVRAYRSFDKFGIESLKQTEQENEPLLYGHVRVRMHAASLNFRDLMVIKGLYNPKLKQPEGTIPLSDGAGEVVEIAAGVTRVKVGDRVAACFMQKWLSGEVDAEKGGSSLGAHIDGVLTGSRVFNQDGLVPFPEHLSYEEAATLPCAAVTAWHGLVVSGQVKPGDTVLLQGTGGVSIFALQFAKMAGAKTIITSSSDEKLQQAKKLGADHLINYKTSTDWEKIVLEITGGRGVDHVIEVGGAGTLEKSLRSVCMGGHIAVIGVLSGGSGDFNHRPLLMKCIRMHGIYVGSREMFEAMNTAISAHKMKPVIDHTFSFDEAQKAYKYLESGSHFGKVVIKIR
jgi:NADPH:quinone reductase-like Zn-dependent oxidoreductase